MRKVDLEHNQVIVRGCKKLAQEEKKQRHDNVAKLVHWYGHTPESAVENERFKILWALHQVFLETDGACQGHSHN